MKRHIEKTRASLGELGGMAAAAQASEERILERALKRHSAVLVLIDKMRPGIEGQPDKRQQVYTDLVAERGTLDGVISKARAALSR